jgi:hypothetical protein
MNKPQVGTTFAFMSLIGKQCCIWNDFRWPHPPMSWGDLLNLLDNESFLVGLPKGEGRSDYLWNSKGTESVFAVITSNEPIAYVVGSSVSATETQAWNARFGSILHFRASIPVEEQDRRFKKWGQCVSCYASWLLNKKRPRAQAAEPLEGRAQRRPPPQQPPAQPLDGRAQGQPLHEEALPLLPDEDDEDEGEVFSFG